MTKNETAGIRNQLKAPRTRLGGGGGGAGTGSTHQKPGEDYGGSRCSGLAQSSWTLERERTQMRTHGRVISGDVYRTPSHPRGEVDWKMPFTNEAQGKQKVSVPNSHGRGGRDLPEPAVTVSQYV